MRRILLGTPFLAAASFTVGVEAPKIQDAYLHHSQSQEDPAVAAEVNLRAAADKAIAKGAHLRVYIDSRDGLSTEASCAPLGWKFFWDEAATPCLFKIDASQVSPERRDQLNGLPTPAYSSSITSSITKPSFKLEDPYDLMVAGCNQTGSGWTCVGDIDQESLTEAVRADLRAAAEKTPETPVHTR